MKTIIVKTLGDTHQLNDTVRRIEKCADKNIKDAVVCTRFLSKENFNTIYGEVKDAVALDDYDVFIVAVTTTDETFDTTQIQSLNKAHTLTCMANEMDSAKNYVIMI